MKERKKFKETALGLFLKEKAPNVLETIGEILPEQGALGIVKNLIEGSTMSYEEKLEAQKLLHEQEIELQKIYSEDRESARNREIGWLEKIGKRDAMMLITGVVGLAAFVFMIIALVFFDIPEGNREIFVHAVGIIEGVALSVFNYYYGSSKGSADKTKLLK